jgi:hypothetical protein
MGAIMTSKTCRALVLIAVAGILSRHSWAMDVREFHDGEEGLLHYLRDTVALAGRLNGDNVVELRNRLDNIYSDWLLRFDPLIERRVLTAIEHFALGAGSPADRHEAMIAIGVMRNPSSLNTLDRAAADPDPDVRKYALQAADEIKRASTEERTYEERIRFWESLKQRTK